MLACAFSARKVHLKKTRLVETMNVSDKVINAAKNDSVMRCRLAGVSDLVAADARYHLKCYMWFMRKASCEDKAVVVICRVWTKKFQYPTACRFMI
jgi:hypothetical protein